MRIKLPQISLPVVGNLEALRQSVEVAINRLILQLGRQPLSEDFDANHQRLINLQQPVRPDDAATKRYVDDKVDGIKTTTVTTTSSSGTPTGTNTYLSAGCTADLSLTGSYQDVTGCSVTLDKSGYWLIIGTFSFAHDVGDAILNGVLNAGGVDQAYICLYNAPGTQATSTNSWIYNATAGATAKLRALKGGGAGASTVQDDATTIRAIFLY
jgi:hypothetical protein